MKKTIAGKTYNTDTASQIANHAYGYASDFAHWDETLYQTKKGNYFLYGYGGPMTSYSTDLGNNSRGGGSDIRPMTEHEALRWCEQYEDESAIELHFAHLIEEA
jgi:hypothetical protein